MSRKKITKKKNPGARQVEPRFSAPTADRHDLYQISVQDSKSTMDLIDSVLETRRGGTALRLREDFCGTALLCADWVRSNPERTAVGVDIDRSTLDWGAKHNIETLDNNAARVELVEKDVRQSIGSNFDVITALNFSYCEFHDRTQLVAYLKSVRAALCVDGFLLLDLHGGPDAQFILETPRNMGDFKYVWEQESFDPINNRTTCHIHFHFHDGTTMKRAFSYDWRLWSLPELRDAMTDAGFVRVDTWWDDHDDVIRPLKSTINTEAWIAFLVGWK
jgi:hypothetical protein